MMKLGQPVVPSDIATTPEHARQIAAEIGYPVIIRPAFTLGGAGGGVAYNEQQLDVIAKNGLDALPHYPGAGGAVHLPVGKKLNLK